MKLPLWVKGRDGKWHRFPYEALVQLADGRYGIDYELRDRGALLNIFVDLCEATGWGIDHFFEYHININAYILKDKAGEET